MFRYNNCYSLFVCVVFASLTATPSLSLGDEKRPPSAAKSFSFKVNIQGSLIHETFAECSDLVVGLPDGARNIPGIDDKKRKPQPPRLANRTLILKRGVVRKNSPLLNWYKNRELKKRKEKTLMITLAAKGSPIQWEVLRAYPIRAVYTLDPSSEDRILIESIEFSYHSARRTKAK